MQPVGWWVLQGVSALALLSCAGLAFASAGRVGRHTPYGNVLFLIALGFWFVHTGLIFYVTAQAVGVWTGPPGWGDVFTMLGWGTLTFAFLLLLVRYPRAGEPAGLRGRHVVAPTIAAVVAFVAASAYVWRHPGLDWPEGLLKAAYIALDAFFVVVVMLSVEILGRLRRASLGRLYLLLGLALTAKTTGDLLWLLWPRDNPLGLFATALYPIAGLIAVVALLDHHIAVRPLAERRVVADPAFVEEQLILRDAARRMRGLAGELGERIVLAAGVKSLDDQGYPAQVHHGVVMASAPRRGWRAAVAAAFDRSVAVLGAPGENAFLEVLSAYGAEVERR